MWKRNTTKISKIGIIVVEHTICRIINNLFRNRLRKYDKTSDIVSGLVNYRMMNSLGWLDDNG